MEPRQLGRHWTTAQSTRGNTTVTATKTLGNGTASWGKHSATSLSALTKNLSRHCPACRCSPSVRGQYRVFCHARTWNAHTHCIDSQRAANPISGAYTTIDAHALRSRALRDAMHQRPGPERAGPRSLKGPPPHLEITRKLGDPYGTFGALPPDLCTLTVLLGAASIFNINRLYRAPTQPTTPSCACPFNLGCHHARDRGETSSIARRKRPTTITRLAQTHNSLELHIPGARLPRSDSYIEAEGDRRPFDARAPRMLRLTPSLAARC